MVFKLLSIRDQFSKRLCRDGLQSAKEWWDDVSENQVQLEKYVEGTSKNVKSKRLMWIDFRRPYVPKFAIIFILSI